MKKWNYFIAGLLGVLGILILIFPAFWIKLIVILLGLGAVGYGIYNFSYIKKLSDDSSYRSAIMIRSLVSIIIGLLAVILPFTQPVGPMINSLQLMSPSSLPSI
jgi:uncharacterized membrane protein HdeD (DUF308 family)